MADIVGSLILLGTGLFVFVLLATVYIAANRYKLQLKTPKLVAHNSPCFNVKVNVSRIKMKSNLTLFTAAISLTHEVAQSRE